MTWALTVAALIERQGRFLFVEEQGEDGTLVLNQPAGHVEPGEALLDAVVREVREETGLAFTPEVLVGVYQLRRPDGTGFCRVCYAGRVPEEAPLRPEDPEILGCVWLSPDEAEGRRRRSRLVMRCLEDFRAGQRLPLAAASVVEALGAV